jgi:hypothetical protein
MLRNVQEEKKSHLQRGEGCNHELPLVLSFSGPEICMATRKRIGLEN